MIELSEIRFSPAMTYKQCLEVCRIVDNHKPLVELLTRINTAISESKSEIELADRVTDSCHDISVLLEQVKGHK